MDNTKIFKIDYSYCFLFDYLELLRQFTIVETDAELNKLFFNLYRYVEKKILPSEDLLKIGYELEDLYVLAKYTK